MELFGARLEKSKVWEPLKLDKRRISPGVLVTKSKSLAYPVAPLPPLKKGTF